MHFLTLLNTMLSQFIHPQNNAVIIKLCKLKCNYVLNRANMMKNTYAEWRNKLYQDKEYQLNEI